MNFQETVQLQTQGRLAEAKAGYERLSQVDPINPDLLNNLGLVRLQLGDDPAEGLRLLRQSLHIRPANPKVWVNYLQTLLKRGEIEFARAAALAAKMNGFEIQFEDTRIDPAWPDDENAQTRTVRLMFQQGFYVECAKYILETRLDRPDGDQYLPLWVRACAAVGQLGAVPKELANARYLNKPKSPQFLEALGRYAIYTRDLEKARIVRHMLGREHPGQAEYDTMVALLHAEEAQSAEAGISALERLEDSSEADALKALHFSKCNKPDEAAQMAHRSLSVRERQPRLLAVLCEMHERSGRQEYAEAAIRDAIRASSAHLPFWAKYTELLKKRGAYQLALDTLDKFHATPEQQQDVDLLRSGIAFDTSNYEQARSITEKLLAKKPDDIRLLKNMGLILLKLDERAESLAYLERYLNHRPDDVDALNAKATGLIDQGLTVQATEVVQKIRAIDPDNFNGRNLEAGIHINKGDYAAAARILDDTLPRARTKQEKLQVLMFTLLLWDTIQDWNRCVQIAEQVIRLDPKSRKAYSVAGAALRNQGKHEEAISLLQKAKQVFPDDASLLAELGTVLCNAGRVQEGVDMMKEAVNLGAGWRAQSALCFWLTNDERASADEILAWHRKCGEAISLKYPPAGYDFAARPQKSKIRIGFVSGDLHHHAVATFMRPIFTQMDRTKFELFAYYNNSKVDAVTKALKLQFQQWRDVGSLSDEVLSKTIYADNIDILIDLSGHTYRHRLPVFAMRSAPVQVSMVGYLGTTGLSQMDYYLLMGSEEQKLKQLQKFFTEKFFVCESVNPYEPWEEPVELVELPALRNGYLTFGSFNRTSKISEKTLQLWSRILIENPQTKMVIGAINEFSNQVESIKQRFAAQGVDPQRLVFRPRSNMKQYLEFHNEIDLLLDTSPYSSGTTAHHAIWMGVPTLTYWGETLMSNQCGLINESRGLDEFVVASAEEFVHKAKQYVNDPTPLAAIRQTLRARVIEKNFDDVQAPAKRFETAVLWLAQHHGIVKL